MKKVIIAFSMALLVGSTSLVSEENKVKAVFRKFDEKIGLISSASLRPEACLFTNDSAQTVWVGLNALKPGDTTTVVVPFNVATYNLSLPGVAVSTSDKIFKVTENCPNNRLVFRDLIFRDSPQACKFINNGPQTIWVTDTIGLQELKPLSAATVLVPFDVTTYNPMLALLPGAKKSGESFSVTENCKNKASTFTEARKKYGAGMRASNPQ